jgi:twitching motility two-component system response regulator PilG
VPTVLIADGSPTLRRIITSVLAREDFQVVSAEDGVAAVSQVYRSMPDVAVLDVGLPKLSGYVVARLLKEDPRTAGIPLVLLTSPWSGDLYRGARTGADRVLAKDFEAPQLVTAVRESLAGAGERAADDTPGQPVEVSATEVLQRVATLLDRGLFESSVLADIVAVAQGATGFEPTVAAMLDAFRRFLDYDLAALSVASDKTTYVVVGQDASRQQYGDFLTRTAAALSQAVGVVVQPGELVLRLADPRRQLGAIDDGVVEHYLSVPLHAAGGALLGVLALSSARSGALGGHAGYALELVSSTASLVVDNARLQALVDQLSAQ